MQIRTSSCSRRKHFEICLTFDPDVAAKADVERLKAFFEASVAKGAKFRAGQTFQIGWMTTLFVQRADGDLGITEPDFASLPIRATESVTSTVKHLRLQRDVCGGFGLADEEEFPSIRDSAIVAIDVPQGCEELFLARSAPSDGDSGWFIGPRETDLDYREASNLRRCSLYEIAMLVPASIRFLALPEGFEVMLSGGTARYKRFGEDVVPSPDAVVDQW